MARRVFLITLVVASLVMPACGGDDDSPESSKAPAGTTGTAGATSQIPPGPEGTAAERERGSADGGSSAKSDGSSGRNGSSGKGRSRGRSDGQPGLSAPGLSPGPSGGGSPSEPGATSSPVKSDSAAHRLAKEICANVTLEGIANNLQISLEARDAEFVARAFSRSYPNEHRGAAYKGCLEGFRNPVEPR